jgi:hypothetical protein
MTAPTLLIVQLRCFIRTGFVKSPPVIFRNRAVVSFHVTVAQAIIHAVFWRLSAIGIAME